MDIDKTQTATGELYQVHRTNQKLELLFKEDIFFSELFYKVLQSMAGSHLMPCYKGMENGAIKITYDISQMVALSDCLATISPERIRLVIQDALLGLSQIYDAGFLEYRNISLELDEIFLDANNHQAFLLPIPLKTGKSAMSKAEFERKFRACLQLILRSSPAGDALADLRETLIRDVPLCPDLLDRLKAGEYQPKERVLPSPEPEPEPKPEPPTPWWRKAKKWHLIGQNTPEPVDIVIEGPDFLVGKNPQQVQGVLTCSKTISRIHCRFSIKGGSCFISDMGSSNGTFLNGQRLTPKQAYKVASGDRVRLSTSEFTIEKE